MNVYINNTQPSVIKYGYIITLDMVPTCTHMIMYTHIQTLTHSYTRTRTHSDTITCAHS